MSEMLFDLGGVPLPVSLACLRAKVAAAQVEAVKALHAAGLETGEDEGAEELEANEMEADKVQNTLLGYLRVLRYRSENGDTFEGEDDEYIPELSKDERSIMNALQLANDRLNDLRMAISAVRRKEITEISQLKEARA